MWEAFYIELKRQALFLNLFFSCCVVPCKFDGLVLPSAQYPVFSVAIDKYTGMLVADLQPNPEASNAEMTTVGSCGRQGVSPK